MSKPLRLGILSLLIALVVLAALGLPRVTATRKKVKPTPIPPAARFMAAGLPDAPDWETAESPAQSKKPSAKDLGPRCGGCENINLYCTKEEEISDQCHGGAACFFAASCDLYIQRAACTAGHLKTDTYPYVKVKRLIDDIVTSTADAGHEICVITHELIHSQQDHCKLSRCEDEYGAYAGELTCEELLVEKYCDPNSTEAPKGDCWSASTNYCDTLASEDLAKCQKQQANCSCGADADGCAAHSSNVFVKCLKDHHEHVDPGFQDLGACVYCKPPPQYCELDTPTPTPTAGSWWPTETPTPTPTGEFGPNPNPNPSPVPTPQISPSPVATPQTSPSAAPSLSPSPSVSPSSTPTATATPTLTATATMTVTLTPTEFPTATSTPFPTIPEPPPTVEPPGGSGSGNAMLRWYTEKP